MRSETKEKFDECRRAIGTYSQAALDYINGLPPQYWAQYAVSISRFDHSTSNIAESINKAWKDIRGQPITTALGNMWEYWAIRFRQRRDRKFTTTTGLTDYA